MFARSGVLSLAIALFSNQASALDLDVNNKDSITAAAKTLADGVFAAYKKPLEETQTPGLFGKEYSWWESGNTWTELIEYSYLTGDQQYNDAIAKALWHQRGDFDAFMPPNQTKFLGNNDQSFWGLASLTAHEAGLQKPPQGEWIDFAANVWNTQSARWDTQICNGGLRNQIFAFNNGYTERNSITNGNFFLLSARLAHLTGNTTYQDWATKVFAWSKEVGLVNNESHVFESTDSTDNCSTVVQDQWTNNHAMYTEGAALMYNLTDGSETWAKQTRDFMNASSVFTKDDVLFEICEPKGMCTIQTRAFKSGAIRSYARAGLVAPFIADSVKTLIQASAKGAAENCATTNENNVKDVKCGLEWNTERRVQKNASSGNLGEVTNALSVIKALLWSDAKPFTPGTPSLGSNSTSSDNSSSTSGAAASEHTGGSGTIAASATSALLIAFIAALTL